MRQPLEVLTVCVRDGLFQFLSTIQYIKSLHTLNLPKHHRLEGLDFSANNPDFSSSLSLLSFKHLKKLLVAFDYNEITKDIYDFLKSFPVLESLSLLYVPVDPVVIEAINTYVLEADNLLEFSIIFSGEDFDDCDGVHGLFIRLACETDLVDIDLVSFKPVIIQSKDLLSILASNNTATNLKLVLSYGDYFNDGRQGYGYDDEGNNMRGICEAFELNRSLRSLSYHDDDFSTHGRLFERNRMIWIQTTREAQILVRDARMFSSSKWTRKLCLPVEVIEQILMCSVAQGTLWTKRQIRVIVRCLLDRKTIGMIHSEVVKFDKNVLFVKCKRVLVQLA